MARPVRLDDAGAYRCAVRYLRHARANHRDGRLRTWADAETALRERAGVIERTVERAQARAAVAHAGVAQR